MEWSNEDPRHTIYKRANIIIVREFAPGIPRHQTSFASVETKNAYCVSTYFEEPYTHLGAGDEWPEFWQWVRAPEK